MKALIFISLITLLSLGAPPMLEAQGFPFVQNFPVKILIVPGHDDTTIGAQFRSAIETNLTAELGEKLAVLFSKEKRFEATLTRTLEGYAPEFSEYFKNERESIKKFIGERRARMEQAMQLGIVTPYEGVPHNDVSENGAVTLFGINKWANDHKIDLVLHIHFDDHGGRRPNQTGLYTGFTIYVPEHQLSNASASAAVARSILNELDRFIPQSNMPKERGGIVEDQGLVAIGSNNSLDTAGVLIEYGYIYEPQFLYSETRSAILDEFAFQTYRGIKKFFGDDAVAPTSTKETTLLPHVWKKDLYAGIVGSLDVLSLQAALIKEELYPPAGFDSNGCFITGSFKSCTKAAVKNFQKKHNIQPANGRVGPKTRNVLHALYGE